MSIIYKKDKDNTVTKGSSRILCNGCKKIVSIKDFDLKISRHDNKVLGHFCPKCAYEDDGTYLLIKSGVGIRPEPCHKYEVDTAVNTKLETLKALGCLYEEKNIVR